MPDISKWNIEKVSEKKNMFKECILNNEIPQKFKWKFELISIDKIYVKKLILLILNNFYLFNFCGKRIKLINY